MLDTSEIQNEGAAIELGRRIVRTCRKKDAALLNIGCSVDQPGK